MKWGSVNFFSNGFSSVLGEALAPHDPDSGSRALADLEEEGVVAASSPDSALNGNLPKRREVGEGHRVLIKSGKPANLFQEPMNERIATLFCSRILHEGDFVPYALERNGYPRSVCSRPCMVDGQTEFVPAADIILSAHVPNGISRFEAYARICEEHGIRPQPSRMLAVDHTIANFDRHWGNFGVLADAETRKAYRRAARSVRGRPLMARCGRARRLCGRGGLDPRAQLGGRCHAGRPDGIRAAFGRTVDEVRAVV